MPHSYKPAPLDLSAIELNAKTEELVDRLSENTHNVWARERISQVKMRIYVNTIFNLFSWEGRCYKRN